jgi:RNA polymerase subunit RPABC4/transcription elongation factor Spt4
VGHIVLEKIVPTPAGSAISSVASQLIDMDPIDSKIALKLAVCDKGGYAIKVDEFEF